VAEDDKVFDCNCRVRMGLSSVEVKNGDQDLIIGLQDFLDLHEITAERALDLAEEDIFVEAL